MRHRVPDHGRRCRTTHGDEPGKGNDSDSSAAGSQPHAGTSDKPLPGPATTETTTPLPVASGTSTSDSGSAPPATPLRRDGGPLPQRRYATARGPRGSTLSARGSASAPRPASWPPQPRTSLPAGSSNGLDVGEGPMTTPLASRRAASIRRKSSGQPGCDDAPDLPSALCEPRRPIGPVQHWAGADSKGASSKR